MTFNFFSKVVMHLILADFDPFKIDLVKKIIEECAKISVYEYLDIFVKCPNSLMFLQGSRVCDVKNNNSSRPCNYVTVIDICLILNI